MLLSAIPILEKQKEDLRLRVAHLKSKPTLAIVRVGEDMASKKYVANKQKLCEEVGVNSMVIEIEESKGQEFVADMIKYLNRHGEVTGILLQLPLPKGYDENYLTQLISPHKDVDGFTCMNLGKLVIGERAPRACTPKGIMNLLEFYNIELEGKDVLIVNRSNIVGKPLAFMMLEKNATVTIAHSKTKNLFEKTRQADIIVTAVGRSNFFRYKDFKKNAVVIDVSINFNESTGKLCGDVNKDDYEKINMITPVPNGVGRTTVLALVEQCIEMQERREGNYA